MSESREDQFARVQLMASGDTGNWDLSANDTAALKTVVAELSRMRTALEGAEKDGARYRFLRRFDHFSTVDAMLDTMDYHTLDAAVDAAMQRAAIAERALTAGSGNE
jgi:hypothetical protein